MKIIERIIEIYPELQNADLEQIGILLQNDSDGVGAYIAKWEYSKPIPDGLTLGKPTA